MEATKEETSKAKVDAAFLMISSISANRIRLFSDQNVALLTCNEIIGNNVTASWIIWRHYNGKLKGENVMKKKVSLLFIAFALLCSTTLFAFAALDNFAVERTYSNQFSDVTPNAWYYDSVKNAYEFNLVNGSSATTFSPNSHITVAEVQTIVARIHSTYHNQSISPALGPWYTPYIEYCINNIDHEVCSMAYMADGETTIANTPASRSYFAYLMYAALPQSEYTAINDIPSGTLPDVDDIAFFDANERIYALYRAGILTGSDSYGTFNPESNITRAEVATIVSRVIGPNQRKTFQLQAVSKPTTHLTGYEGEYFVSDGDSSRPWIGYELNVWSVNKDHISFDFQRPKSGHSIEYTAQDAVFTSATTAVGYGTCFYGDLPENTNPVKYEFVLSNHNIHLKVYVGESTEPGFEIDFACGGTMQTS